MGEDSVGKCQPPVQWTMGALTELQLIYRYLLRQWPQCRLLQSLRASPLITQKVYQEPARRNREREVAAAVKIDAALGH